MVRRRRCGDVVSICTASQAVRLVPRYSDLHPRGLPCRCCFSWLCALCVLPPSPGRPGVPGTRLPLYGGGRWPPSCLADASRSLRPVWL